MEEGDAEKKGVRFRKRDIFVVLALNLEETVK
jgi:hypothetical protein